LALQVFRRMSLASVAAAPVTVGEIVQRADLSPTQAPVPLAWILRQLTARGVLECSPQPGGADLFRCASPLPDLDPAGTSAAQERLDPAASPSYRLASLVAESYPTLLRGEKTGEEILLGPDLFGAWGPYFSNENSLYAISNSIGAIAAGRWAPVGRLRILELGGGFGSAAVALLDELNRRGRIADLDGHHFTEFAPPFLRRGQRALAARFPGAGFLKFGLLDMNRPFAEAGVARESLSLVYCVNTLHVAHDLEFTLREIRDALAPGGWLVVGECVRPFPRQSVYVEFIFNLLEAFRSPLLHPEWRPNGGFLTPEQWSGAFAATGFEDFRLFPDIRLIRETYPSFIVAALGGRRPLPE
jgi:SAM-dependent methyltransferase